MSTGTIEFTSPSALAIWKNEILGQMSDGMWENSRPFDHWKFWGRLEATVGTEDKAKAIRPWECKKTGYSMSKLIEVVGDRMMKIGKMGSVTQDEHALSTADYMPATLEEWKESKLTGKWKYEFVGKYMAYVTQEIAEAFYASEYGEAEFKADIKRIKQAIKSVKEVK